MSAATRVVACDFATAMVVANERITQVAVATPDGLEGENSRISVPLDPDDNLMSRAVVSRKMQHVPDWSAVELPPFDAAIRDRAGSASVLLMPLLRGEDCVGLLGFVRKAPKPFSAEDISLLKTFADQAVIAIQNARLFNETQTALVRQTASADILRVISASPTDVTPVFEAIVQAAIDLVTCDEALVIETDGKELWNAAEATRHGLATDLPSARVPVDPDDNLPSRVIVTKKMSHIPDWAAIDLPERDRQRVERLGNRATLALPLMRAEECLGMLAFVRNTPTAFSAEEIAMAQTFNDQAMIAIENVRLFREAQDARTAAERGQRGQERVPGHHEPRDPHADERGHRDERALDGYRSGR